MDKVVTQELLALVIKALQDDGSIVGEVKTDSHGCNHVRICAFSTKVRIDMDVNISPDVTSQLCL